MGWLDVLKEMLSSIASILKDIPVWAKTVICLLTFGILALAVLTNLEQVVVYLIEVQERPEAVDGARYVILQVDSGHETNYVTSTNDIVRASIPVKTGLLSDVGREFRILRRTTVSGQQPRNATFTYAGKRPLQSGFIVLSVECRTEGNFSCEAVARGKQPASLPIPPSWVSVQAAHAAEARAPTINVPTLETLRDVTPDGGYAEVRVTDLRLARGVCAKVGCPAQMFVKVEFNGVEFLFDGLRPEITRRSDLPVGKEGDVSRNFVFGIENTLFKDVGNVLRLTFYLRQAESTGFLGAQQKVSEGISQRIDVGEVHVELFRNVALPIMGKEAGISGKVQVRPVKGRLGQSRAVFIGAGTYEEVIRKRGVVNERLAAEIELDGNRIAAVVRPPLRTDSKWGLSVGVVEPGSDRVRLLLSEDEAKKLMAKFRALSDSVLKPLSRDEFFVQQVTSSSSSSSPSR